MAGILRSGLRSAGQFEQTTIAFETMLGSAKETQETLNDLTIFAAKTPFEMPEITQAARGLIQFGERGDDLMETLNILGNAASGTSTPFSFLALVFNQVRGVGKLLTQDFRQLSTRGVISMQDLADHFGITLAQAEKKLSSGQIKFEDLREILKKLSSEGGRFANLMEKQSQSLVGLGSTLSDAWNIMARVLASSLVPAAKAFTSIMIKMVELIQAFVEWTDGLASAALAGATGVAMLSTMFLGLGLAAKFAGISMKGALIGTGIGVVLIGLGAVAGVLIDKFDVLEKISQAVSLGIDKFSLAAQSAATWTSSLDLALNKMAQAAGYALNRLLIGIANIAPTVGLAVISIMSMLVPLVNVAGRVGMEMAVKFMKAFNTIAQIGAVAAQSVFNAFVVLNTGLSTLLSDAVEIMRTQLVEIINVIKKVIEVVGRVRVGDLAGAKDKLLELGDTLNVAADNIGNSWSAAAGTIANTTNKLAAGIKGTDARISDLANDLWDNISTPPPGMTSGIIDIVTGALRKGHELTDSFMRGFGGSSPFGPVKNKRKGGVPLPGKTDTPAKTLLEQGRYGLPEMANKIQDNLLKKDDKTQLDKDRNGLLEAALKKQDELITATKESKGAAATLTGGD